MDAMRVSAIIPVFNQEAFIGDAVESVLAQDCPVHEIIVVDDGSDDATPEVLRALSDRSPRVLLRRQSRQGVAAARNAGIAAATGEWIAFLDADDMWSTSKVSNAAAAIEATDGDVQFVHSNRRNLFPDGSSNEGLEATPEQMRNPIFLLGGFAIKTSSVMIRRDLLASLGTLFPAGRRTCEDFDLFWRAVITARAIAYVPNRDAIVRMFPGSLSRGTTEVALLEDNVRTIASVTNWTRSNGVNGDRLEALQTHMYWKVRELFRARMAQADLTALAGDARDALHQLGARRTGRALASASLGLLARR